MGHQGRVAQAQRYLQTLRLYTPPPMLQLLSSTRWYWLDTMAAPPLAASLVLGLGGFNHSAAALFFPLLPHPPLLTLRGTYGFSASDPFWLVGGLGEGKAGWVRRVPFPPRRQL